MDDQGFLVGQMLIAMPGIGDPRFERALLLICAHDEGHAMGLAVNRPVEGLTVPDLLRRLEVEHAAGAPDELVMMGGPVERERGFVLHTDDYQSKDDNSLLIGDGVALTAPAAPCWRSAMPAGARASWSRRSATMSGSPATLTIT
jgi:putative transcriptional regulator